MGHVRLGELPRTRQWNQVVELLHEGAGVGVIAHQAIEAAAHGFELASYDRGLQQATWLLAQLPDAARAENYVDRLNDLGVSVNAKPSVVELVTAVMGALDVQMRRAGGRTDFGEMAQMATAETLTSILTAGTASLWGTTPADIQNQLSGLATEKQFGLLAREFFSRLSRRFLSFYLSRELSNHVGGSRRFANMSEHAAFNDALRRHCYEASKIVQDYSGEWWGKHRFEGGITPKDARRYSAYALKKMRSEFKRGALA